MTVTRKERRALKSAVAKAMDPEAMTLAERTEAEAFVLCFGAGHFWRQRLRDTLTAWADRQEDMAVGVWRRSKSAETNWQPTGPWEIGGVNCSTGVVAEAQGKRLQRIRITVDYDTWGESSLQVGIPPEVSQPMWFEGDA